MEMFAMYKSNHATECSLGISGIGGKVASFILSQQRKVTIFTHYEGEIKYQNQIIITNHSYC